MDILIWIIWAGTYLLGAVRFELYIVHMFQQNSYRNGHARKTSGEDSVCLYFSAASAFGRKRLYDRGLSVEYHDDIGK